MTSNYDLLLNQSLTLKNLSKLLLQGEIPKEELWLIPAQQLILAIRHNGLAESIDTLQAASIEQSKIMLDLDIWDSDIINEEHIFEWLSLDNSDDPLVFQQKILKFIDLKIIAYLIVKYVESVTYEEPTTAPPDESYFTPDKGYTWIKVNLDNQARFYGLNRFLALIFETIPDIFYQLLQIRTTSTNSEILEEAYQDKTKRLLELGIPDLNWALEINAKFNLTDALRLLGINRTENSNKMDLSKIEKKDYFNNLIKSIDAKDDFNSEVTLILNAAIVRFKINFYEIDDIVELIEKVKGAIEIGLEQLINLEPDLTKIYNILGLQKIYRLGLTKIISLTNESLKAIKLKTATNELVQLELALNRPFPNYPIFLDGPKDSGYELPGGFRAFESEQDLNKLTTYLLNK